MGTTKRRLVLVTGLPRSGTTVVGDVLATAEQTTSLYEPMNFQSGDVRFDASFPVCGSDEFSRAEFQLFLQDLTSLRLNLRNGLFPHDTGMKAIAKWFTGGRSRVSYLKSRISLFSQNIIWKDPFAIFCLPAALDKGLDVVVTYRPPAAIAASYKRLHWSYDTTHLAKRLAQTVWGTQFCEEPRGIDVAGISKPVAAAVFLWMASSKMILHLADRGANVSVVSTGELPNDYQGAFDHLFEKMSLKQTDKTRRLSQKRFEQRNDLKKVPNGHPHSQNRDLKSVNTYWKQVLSEPEIEYVETTCSTVQSRIESLLMRSPAIA